MTRRRWGLIAASGFALGMAAAGLTIAVTADHSVTPPIPAETIHQGGAVDPRVTQDNIGSTICVKGYTATVRPPLSYTAPIKRRLWTELGKPGKLSDYELDHNVPLEVGGAPEDLANLWLEPIVQARRKDKVENRVHTLVCNGTITLAAGQQCFITDWRKCP